jgi:glycine cleavage system H protein
VYPTDLRYSKEHEWARVEGARAAVGITQFAADQLGDVVYVDVTLKVGDQIKQFDAFGTVESVKAASELFCPVSGRIARINDQLADQPELVNQDPYGKGWMVEVDLADPAEVDALLSAADYEASLPAD